MYIQPQPDQTRLAFVNLQEELRLLEKTEREMKYQNNELMEALRKCEGEREELKRVMKQIFDNIKNACQQNVGKTNPTVLLDEMIDVVKILQKYI